MKTITRQEVIDFINRQPDDREVDMGESHSYGTCGCVMIHLGQEIISDEINSVGNKSFFAAGKPVGEFEDGFRLVQFHPKFFGLGKTNYAYLKTLVNEKQN